MRPRKCTELLRHLLSLDPLRLKLGSHRSPAAIKPNDAALVPKRDREFAAAADHGDVVDYNGVDHLHVKPAVLTIAILLKCKVCATDDRFAIGEWSE